MGVTIKVYKAVGAGAETLVFNQTLVGSMNSFSYSAGTNKTQFNAGTSVSGTYTDTSNVITDRTYRIEATLLSLFTITGTSSAADGQSQLKTLVSSEG